MTTMRWRCGACEAVSNSESLLGAPNPFGDGTVTGCPVCRACEPEWTPVCDEAGCDEPATCGWPSPGGYRNTCGAHWRDGDAA